MSTSNRKSEYVEFINFWEWEYTRRNEQWRDSYIEQVTKCKYSPLYKGKAIHYIEIGKFCGFSVEGNENHYKDSNAILEDLIFEKFKYLSPLSLFFKSYRYDASMKFMELFIGNSDGMNNDDVQREFNAQHDELFNKLLLDYKSGDRLVCFNLLQDDPELLLKWINSEKIRYEEERRAIQLKKKDPCLYVDEKSVKYNDALSDYQLAEMKKRYPMKGKWKNNKQRAVGLWLYDCCIDNKCGGPTAIATFRRTHYCRDLGYNTKEDREFERWLAGTRRCIDSSKVLPLT